MRTEGKRTEQKRRYYETLAIYRAVQETIQHRSNRIIVLSVILWITILAKRAGRTIFHQFLNSPHTTPHDTTPLANLINIVNFNLLNITQPSTEHKRTEQNTTNSFHSPMKLDRSFFICLCPSLINCFQQILSLSFFLFFILNLEHLFTFRVSFQKFQNLVDRNVFENLI